MSTSASSASSTPSVAAPVAPAVGSSARPSNVGVHAIDMYFPRHFVAQTELEKANGVSAGKYTIGLGQSKMAFCTDREDIYSVCLSGQTTHTNTRREGTERVRALESVRTSSNVTNVHAHSRLVRSRAL